MTSKQSIISKNLSNDLSSSKARIRKAHSKKTKKIENVLTIKAKAVQMTIQSLFGA